MESECKPPVGLFDLRISGASPQAQDLIIVLLGAEGGDLFLHLLLFLIHCFEFDLLELLQKYAIRISFHFGQANLQTAEAIQGVDWVGNQNGQIIFQIAGMEKTTKIENDHADEQIEVEGSSISSKSDAANDQFQQHKEPPRQNTNNYDGTKQPNVEGAYEPSQYANLPISADLKELFKSIQRYTPTLQELDTKLKAFIPEYIPAIGEVDAFLKMPRPDDQPETLGLYVLDEPALNQSDKAKIDLQLLNNNKQYRGGKNSKIHSIQSAQKNPKQILSWIQSVSEIHKSKQPPSVNYSKRMPDIDSLMQVWPQQVQEVLAQIVTPSEEIDLSLADYAKVACTILDVPVHQGLPNSLIESLHVVFTLYSAFKENQHFALGQQNESFVDGHR